MESISQEQLENRIQRLREDREVSDKQKDQIVEFVKACRLEKLSNRRISKYIGHLQTIAKLLGPVDFDTARREDFERVLLDIESEARGFSLNTVYDIRVAIKKFYRRKNKERLPKKVAWIRTISKKKRRREIEEVLLPEEIKRMIDAAISKRDKALISVFYESGIRSSELLGMRIKSVAIDGYGALIDVQCGKPYSHRKVRIVTSMPYLTDWLNCHPQKTDPESSLWVCLGPFRKDKQWKETLDYRGLWFAISRISKRAGIKKKVYPHLFRHSRATFLANHLTEAQLCKIFGWGIGSEMPAVYVHLSARDTDSAILELNGVKMDKKDAQNNAFALKKCINPSCLLDNQPTNIYCGRCGLPLDEKTALMPLTKEKALINLLSDPDVKFNMDPDMVKRLLSRMA